MKIVVAGGHGQIALRLLGRLADQGHEAVGLVRNPEHVADLEAVGARGAIADLEGDAPLTDAVMGADAVVFAAGAGPGSGPERKRTVDLGGAVKLIEAADATGVRRYVMVSSIGAQDPEAGTEAMVPYYRAKAEADEALMGSALDWTIVRPGRLTDAPGSGRVRISTDLGERADVSRDDVAAVLAAVLAAPHTVGKVFELFDGETPIDEALAAL
jgi:uncharacterized protein YbjT (DUF2867 family)